MKFVEFKRSDDGKIKIDIDKIVAYEPSTDRAYPGDEYTSIIFYERRIFVKETYGNVDRKINGTVNYNPDRRMVVS